MEISTTALVSNIYIENNYENSSLHFQDFNILLNKL